MLNTYPKWKYGVLLGLMLLSILYALPNLYGDDPAIQVQGDGSMAQWQNILSQLESAQIPIKRIEQQDKQWLVRFPSEQAQQAAHQVLEESLPEEWVMALNLAPATPAWLTRLGAAPMRLGLDLRGGVHFLMDVDVQSALNTRQAASVADMKRVLQEQKVRYRRVHPQDDHIIIALADREQQATAMSVLKRLYHEWEVVPQDEQTLALRYNAAMQQEVRQYTLEQTMTTLRNRVNELGVSEAVVHRQGLTQVVVELPGVQDTARAKDLLGKTATLSFHLADGRMIKPGSVAPAGTRWVAHRDGRMVLLKKQPLLTGDSVIAATPSLDSRDGMPVVGVRLGGNIQAFKKATRDNIGQGMAVVYVETQTHSKTDAQGESSYETVTHEDIISLATIQSALGNQFQISGLSYQDSQDLALLLRSGALPARVSIIEERTIGPSLGAENITKGLYSVGVGFALVVILMGLYYSVFGWVANVALLCNLIMLVAALSLLGATLTLPGIAGIVLTVGMAVDANVLIFERIREEWRAGLSVQASLYSGFDRAMTTIVDANITTLIVGAILFGVGSGPVKGFAVTLCIGIATSMITAIWITRAMINLLYGHRPAKTLHVGI